MFPAMPEKRSMTTSWHLTSQQVDVDDIVPPFILSVYSVIPSHNCPAPEFRNCKQKKFKTVCYIGAIIFSAKYMKTPSKFLPSPGNLFFIDTQTDNPYAFARMETKPTADGQHSWKSPPNIGFFGQEMSTPACTSPWTQHFYPSRAVNASRPTFMSFLTFSCYLTGLNQAPRCCRAPSPRQGPQQKARCPHGRLARPVRRPGRPRPRG